jgi:hypothetical protein
MRGLPKGGEIKAGSRDAVTQIGRGCGTDFDLAARLGGEHTPARERPWAAQRGHGGGQSLLVHRQRGVTAIADQPFQFHPDPPGWPGLEADPVYLRFRVAFGQRFGFRPTGPVKKWVVTLRRRRGIGL